MNIAWITGASGLIGNYLVQTAPLFAPQYRLRALRRTDFDLLDHGAMERAFMKDQPKLIIHCAAITTILDAENNPPLAQRVNVEATKFLAHLAAGIPFVFFSTDLIFDGTKGDYLETDAANPLHVYGETKLAAEEIVFRNARHLIIRTSLNGGTSLTGKRGFNEMYRQVITAMGADGMTLFTDEFRCPLPAVETARAVWELVEKNCAGIYHVAGAERLSRYQIGELLMARWPEINARIRAGSINDFPGPPRAPDTSLNISKVQNVLTKPLPGLGEWLAANPSVPF